jgi:hypothetical protein
MAPCLNNRGRRDKPDDDALYVLIQHDREPLQRRGAALLLHRNLA